MGRHNRLKQYGLPSSSGNEGVYGEESPFLGELLKKGVPLRRSFLERVGGVNQMLKKRNGGDTMKSLLGKLEIILIGLAIFGYEEM